MDKIIFLVLLLAYGSSSCASGGSSAKGDPSKTAAAPRCDGENPAGDCDPYSSEIKVCLNAYDQVKPVPKAIMGAVEHGDGCAISIMFETQRDLEEFVRWRVQHSLAPRMLAYVVGSKVTQSIPLQLKVGGPILEEIVIQPRSSRSPAQPGVAPDRAAPRR